MLVLGLVLGMCGEQDEHGPSWSIVDEPWDPPSTTPLTWELVRASRGPLQTYRIHLTRSAGDSYSL